MDKKIRLVQKVTYEGPEDEVRKLAGCVLFSPEVAGQVETISEEPLIKTSKFLIVVKPGSMQEKCIMDVLYYLSEYVDFKYSLQNYSSLTLPGCTEEYQLTINTRADESTLDGLRHIMTGLKVLLENNNDI